MVTDGPMVVRVVSSAQRGAGVNRPSTVRPFSGAAPPSAALDRQLSRPPSARDAPATYAQGRPGSALPRPPVGGGFELGERGSGGGRLTGLDVQMAGGGGARESGGRADGACNACRYAASPSATSASGLQGVTSYEDIPDVPWEEGERSWTEAAEVGGGWAPEAAGAEEAGMEVGTAHCVCKCVCVCK